MKRKIRATIALCLAAAAVYASAQAVLANETEDSAFYSDVNSTSYAWAVDYVDDITRKQIATGVGNNKFAPGSTIKRCDFIIFVDKTFNLSPANQMAVAFSDVNSSAYYAQSAINAKAAGIVKDSSFYPEISITRQDAMLYIYRALNVKNYVGNNASSDLSAFSDAAQVKAGETEIAVATLHNIGVIAGDDGRIKPNDTMTRAEMAVVFSKVSDYVDEVKKEQAAQKEADTEQTSEAVVDDTKISGGTVTEAIEVEDKDMFISDAAIGVANQSKPAVSVKNGSVIIKDSSVRTTGYSAVNVSTNGAAKLVDTTVKANGSSAVKVSDNGEVEIEGGSVKEDGDIVANGMVRISGGSVDISNGALVKGDVSSAVSMLNGTELTVGSGSVLKSNSDKGTIKISAVTGEDDFLTDDVNDKSATIGIMDSTIENNAKNGTVFLLEDGNAVVNLENSTVKGTYLCDIYTENAFKSTGNDITFNLENQTVEGDIKVNNLTAVTLNVGKNSSYKGSVNANNESDSVDIYVDDSATLEFTGTCCFNKFVINDTTMNNIIGNGHYIYYDGGDPDNSNLDRKTYDLVNGGQLIPY